MTVSIPRGEEKRGRQLPASKTSQGKERSPKKKKKKPKRTIPDLSSKKKKKGASVSGERRERQREPPTKQEKVVLVLRMDRGVEREEHVSDTILLSVRGKGQFSLKKSPGAASRENHPRESRERPLFRGRDPSL